MVFICGRDTDRAPAREYKNYQGETIKTPPDPTIGICTDGTLWFWKLNTEAEKEVSKTDKFCIKHEELCIKNEELCIKNKEFSI